MANMATALLILLLAAPAVYAVEYTVGDSSGWTLGYNYANWVSGKTFKVGDVLVFKYDSTHKVDVVQKSDYDNCDASNSLETHDDGNTKINLNETGVMYFICPTSGHCAGGMKLAANIAAASSTTPGTPAPSGSETPSAGTPPSTTSPSPSSAAACIFCNVYYTMAVFISLAVLASMG